MKVLLFITLTTVCLTTVCSVPTSIGTTARTATARTSNSSGFVAMSTERSGSASNASMAMSTERSRVALNGSMAMSTERSRMASNVSMGSTVKPKHCIFHYKHKDDIEKHWKKCEELTGFPGNMTNPQVSFVQMIEAKDFDDNCFGRCMMEKMKMLKKDGEFRKDEISKALKSNATAEVEKNRIHDWKTCADKIENAAKSATGKKSSYCKAPIKFMACGLKAEEEAYKKCH